MVGQMFQGLNPLPPCPGIWVQKFFKNNCTNICGCGGLLISLHINSHKQVTTMELENVLEICSKEFKADKKFIQTIRVERRCNDGVFFNIFVHWSYSGSNTHSFFSHYCISEKYNILLINGNPFFSKTDEPCEGKDVISDVLLLCSEYFKGAEKVEIDVRYKFYIKVNWTLFENSKQLDCESIYSVDLDLNNFQHISGEKFPEGSYHIYSVNWDNVESFVTSL